MMSPPSFAFEEDLAPPPASGELESTPRVSLLGDFLSDAHARMWARARGEDKPVLTPWPTFNRALGGGLWPGLYVLASASGVGKTQWALQASLAAASAGDRVLYVALELGPLEMIARIYGLLGGVPWSHLAYGKDPERLRETLHQHEATLRSLPFHMEVAPLAGWPFTRLPVLAETVAPRLLVVDYGQLVSSEKGDAWHEEPRLMMKNLARCARQVARDQNIAVLILSSTARSNYAAVDGSSSDGTRGLGKGDPARFIGLGKESGELEFTADGVFALAHEPQEEGAPSGERTSWLAVAKGRGCGTGWVRFRWNGFAFMDPDVEPTCVAPRSHHL